MHAERDFINALKDSACWWYEDWSVWVIGILSLISLLGVAWFTYQNVCCPTVQPKEIVKEKDVSMYELNPPERTPLYPDIQHLLRKPTAPVHILEPEGQYAAVRENQRTLKELHRCIMAMQH